MIKLSGSLCLLGCLLGIIFVTPANSYTIQGRIYCDTCRAGFETSATEYVEGAKVRIECRNYATGEITQKVEGVTDNTGTYNIEIAGENHEEEICEVVLVESSRKDCNEIKDGRDRARILLTDDSGISSDIRYANSLGFLKADPLPVCGQLLQMYALSDDLN